MRTDLALWPEAEAQSVPIAWFADVSSRESATLKRSIRAPSRQASIVNRRLKEMHEKGNTSRGALFPFLFPLC